MDFAILASAISLFKKIMNFLFDYQSDTFGTGAQGDVYIGNGTAPKGYTSIAVPTGTYVFPVSLLLHYNNLVIDENISVTASTPYLFLYVKEKLTVNGTLTMSGKGNNSYTFSSFLPLPARGQSTLPYTVACLKMFLSGREIRTTQDLMVSGGNKNTEGKLSGGGTNGAGGGLIALYHKVGKLTLKGEGGNERIHANGGTSGDIGGGMMFVSSREIELGGFGSITCDGGNGQGCVSYIDDIPRNTNSQGQPNPSSQWGGGGVVVHTPLNIL